MFIIIILIYFFLNQINLIKFIFSIIIGGALGNFYDRINFNAVPDFIDLHYGNFHWFTFNVADIFITLGIIIFFIKNFFIKKKKKKNYFNFYIYFFILSSGGLKDAGKVLRNEKIKTTDEFLVKKKEPLVFLQIIIKFLNQDSKNQKKKLKMKMKKLKKFLKVPEEKNKNKNKSSSVEKSIIDKIRK